MIHRNRLLRAMSLRLKTDYVGDEDEGNDGDDESLGGENAGSDTGSKGRAETNSDHKASAKTS